MIRTQHYPPRHTRAPRNGSTRAWRRLRLTVLHRANHRCQRCGAHATEVHHITPVLMGGRDTLPNLQALCTPCHNTHR